MLTFTLYPTILIYSSCAHTLYLYTINYVILFLNLLYPIAVHSYNVVQYTKLHSNCNLFSFLFFCFLQCTDSFCFMFCSLQKIKHLTFSLSTHISSLYYIISWLYGFLLILLTLLDLPDWLSKMIVLCMSNRNHE